MLMSLTRTVPARLPFDFHSSRPWVPSSAAKNNLPAHTGQAGGSVVGVAGTGMDVLDQDGARPGAIGLPQLRAVGAVAGGEEQPSAHSGQGGGIAAVVDWFDVLDQDGARPGAIGLPQLPAVGAVVGGEEQPSAHTGQGGGIAAGSRLA